MPHYYRNVHAVVFVYDVTKMSSFESLPMWIEECDRHSLTQNLPRILVGNKCDMEQLVAVNTHTAQRFADNHNMPLFETSAKDDSQMNHVESIFLTLAHKLKSSKSMMPTSSESNGVHSLQETPTLSDTRSSNDSSSCLC